MAIVIHQGGKKLAIVVHDLAMTALAVVLTFVTRFDGPMLDERLLHLPQILPFFVAYAGCVYWFFSLYRSKWRFASLPDLSNIVRAVTVLTVTMLAVDYVLVAPNIYGYFFFGKITIALYWLLQIALLGGPRLAYRYFKFSRSRSQAQKQAAMPALVLGRGAEIETVIRAMESGAMRKMLPAGILSPRADDVGQSIRGVRVLGLLGEIEEIVRNARIAAKASAASSRRRARSRPRPSPKNGSPRPGASPSRSCGSTRWARACAIPSSRPWRSRICWCGPRWRSTATGWKASCGASA
jgi:O-antigen biosynthesis protein WbqV